MFLNTLEFFQNFLIILKPNFEKNRGYKRYTVNSIPSKFLRIISHYKNSLQKNIEN